MRKQDRSETTSTKKENETPTLRPSLHTTYNDMTIPTNNPNDTLYELSLIPPLECITSPCISSGVRRVFLRAFSGRQLGLICALGHKIRGFKSNCVYIVANTNRKACLPGLTKFSWDSLATTKVILICLQTQTS